MRTRALAAVWVLVLLGAACTSDEPGTLRLYTSVTQDTVDSVVDGFQSLHPDVAVEVFRAPTGELAARIAAEQREGGVQADVLWLTDPLSMQQYSADGLLESWDPAGSDGLPEEYRTDTFWGTRILTMVMVVRDGVEAPTTWAELADARFRDRVAFPDPGFAGSSFAVLGYFSVAEGYGLAFYERLAANGAVQLNAPGEVVTGVAEGRFDVGITLERIGRDAAADGSPIAVVWPSDGAIALYSPIGVVDGADDPGTARDFVEYLLTSDAQQRIAATGWQPVASDVPWEFGGPVVTVDWTLLYDRQEELLDAYRAIFGG